MHSPTTVVDCHAPANGSSCLRKRRGSLGSSTTWSSTSSSCFVIILLASSVTMMLVDARPKGFYAWQSDANAAAAEAAALENATFAPPSTKRTHHLPGSAMSILVDAWLDVQQLQPPNVTSATTSPQVAPSNHHHPSPQHVPHQQQPRSSALLDWHECSSHVPIPRIEILSRHAHDNTITFSIEQPSSSSSLSSRQQHQQACQSSNVDSSSTSTTTNTVSPSLSPFPHSYHQQNKNNMRWLATQFQNSRGNWICATQETAACRKRFIYTASCPTTATTTNNNNNNIQELSWARVALYLADDDSISLQQKGDDEHVAKDTCTVIRNSVESSRQDRQQQKHRRQQKQGQTCAFHFQLPCQPIIKVSTASEPVTQSSSSSSWSSTTSSSSSSSTTMSAI